MFGALGLLAGVTPATPAFAAGGFAVAQPMAPAGPLSGRTIVVDPGHGGRDPGAMANGIREKDVNLAMGLGLKPMLESRGAKVILTRASDVALGPNEDADLQARVAAAQQAHASAFVSIHANAMPGNAGYAGATTYYGPTCGFRSGASQSPVDVGRSYSLGRRIQAKLVQATGEADHGTQPQTFWVLGDPGIPAVLVETAFVTNKDEAAKLADPGYQAQIDNAIADGVADFFASGDADKQPAPPSSAVRSCVGPPPAQEPPTVWVQTFLPAPLLAGPDPNAKQFTMLSPFFYLKVLGSAKNYLYVINPETNGPGYVEAAKVGPSGPPPSFEPFWVENFAPTGVWSGPAGGIRFGTAPRWSFFQVVAPQDGPRLFVKVAATGNVAYVDAKDVGPSGPPR